MLVSSPDPPHHAPPKGRGVEGLGTRLLRCRVHDVMFKFAVRLVVDPVDVGHSTSYRSGGWWVLY